MRFIKDGPSIPDELLIARDEGRVVFFCGAGVSKAKANLADFRKLTKNVLDKCRIRDGEHIHKLFTDDKVSADRIFGLLEQEFDEDYLQKIVAMLLKPSDTVDLSAHRILLDLATTAEGVTRIVTTNFDRLFEAAAKEATNLKPLELIRRPCLLDISFNGVVHLHGLANTSYDGAEGQGFVLTSSSYGQAYLAEGWATGFIQAILQQYIVVFIGYSADDPPIQYLLEALRKTPGLLHGVYAFQDGKEREAHEKWAHKGVKAIAYDGENRHSALWDTLAVWAKRATSPEGWQQTVLGLARQDAKTLQPFERGQVAHLVSTAAGAKAFAEATDVPPAEWLCVFDAYQRYAKPFRENIGVYELGKMYDPFDDYGLDKDSQPQRISEEKNHRQQERKVPDTAWDAFKTTPHEIQTLFELNSTVFRGYFAMNAANLPPRLKQLAIWLSKIVDQPTAVWWASHYRGLHPEVQALISWEILNGKKAINPVIRQAWIYLIGIWRDDIAFMRTYPYRLFSDFKQLVKIDGWSNQVLRQYAAITRPYLAVQPWKKPKLPLCHDSINMSDLLDLKVQYFNHINDIEIPSEWLALVIRELCKHLEYAFQLEKEIENIEINCVESILHPEGFRDYQENFYSFVLIFYRLFAKLAEFDGSAASKELSVWLSKDEYLFTRLGICAGGISGLVSDQAFFAQLVNLSDELFWDYWHRSDLLHVLAKRWNAFTEAMKQTLEQRLLAGIKPSDDETTEDFNKRNASVILNRLHWLQNQGCLFTFDLAAETKKLQAYSPQWTQDKVNNAAESSGSRAWTGRQAPDESYAELLTENLANILSKAEELASTKSDFRVDKEPYSGFCKAHPKRSFSALTCSAKQDHFPRWAWETFLDSDARQNDEPKFSALIAERIACYPAEKLTQLLYSFTSWLKKSGETLAIDYPESYYKLMTKLIQTMEYLPSVNPEIIRISRLRDWVFEAINSQVARLANVLMVHPTLDQLGENGDLSEQWLQSVEKLLALPGNLNCYALIIFAQDVEWFYSHNEQWTEANLLVALSSSNNNDKLAFWSGFLQCGKTPYQNLYLKLKPEMLRFAEHGDLDLDFRWNLTAMILAGWGSKQESSNEPWITPDELHDVILHGGDELRRQLIWHITEWSKEEALLNQLPELFSKVWPQRLSVKTPETSQALLDLVFSDTDIFERIANQILPLMSQATLPILLDINDDIFQHDPEKVLALFHKAFAENVRANLPYDLDTILNRIVDIEPELRKDSRWLALKRKLD